MAGSTHRASHRKQVNGKFAALLEDLRLGTPEGDTLDILATLVEAYEARYFPIDLPDPVEAIKFRMEQAGLSPKDLVSAIGRTNRECEILNRKRPLTLKMIGSCMTITGFKPKA